MYAYRRANVAELNRRGREVWRSLGRLEGPDLIAPGGTAYAVGDRVVTLAPAAGGGVVTSQTATVVAVRPEAKALMIRTDDDGTIHRLEGPEIGAERLAHAYAVTVHRSQGAAVERAHALEDGGGRELAYVKMSRAKDRTSLYVVADTLDQAKDDLRREWGTDRRLGWVIDTATPVTDPLQAERSPTVARPMRDPLRRGRPVAERDAILAVTPPNPAAHIRAAELQRGRLQREGDDLAAGEGRYRAHPVAHALWERRQAENNIARLQRDLARSGTPRADRRRWRAELADWRTKHVAATRAVTEVSGPAIARIDEEERTVGERLSDLWAQHETHQRWAGIHPEAAHRLDHLAGEIDVLNRSLGDDPHRPEHVRGFEERMARLVSTAQDRSLGIDLGL
jgi:hypothetical protein